MTIRIVKLALAAVALIALMPAASLPTSASGSLCAAVGKLNYYRTPGGPPYCINPCDGEGVCCTFPGGPGEEETTE